MYLGVGLCVVIFLLPSFPFEFFYFLSADEFVFCAVAKGSGIARIYEG